MIVSSLLHISLDLAKHTINDNDSESSSGVAPGITVIAFAVTLYNIVHFAVITVGYVQTDVPVSESAGVTQLTVAISVPPQGVPIETSFTLLVNTFDGTAAGLTPHLNFDYIVIYTPLPLSHKL